MDFHPENLTPENLTRDLGGSGASTPVVNAIPVKELSVGVKRQRSEGFRRLDEGIQKEDIITQRI